MHLNIIEIKQATFPGPPTVMKECLDLHFAYCPALQQTTRSAR